jgi:tRNA threonylcarbamoyladenosine biosynthesis protein TsaE
LDLLLPVSRRPFGDAFFISPYIFERLVHGRMGAMKRLVKSLEEMDLFAEEVLASLPLEKEATLLTLKGELGAGKTAFTKAIAKHLGVVEVVNSPTFMVMKSYDLVGRAYKKLIHIDAYRIEDISELKPLKFETLLKDPSNLIVLEWPERISEALPKDARTIKFMFVDETTREVEY